MADGGLEKAAEQLLLTSDMALTIFHHSPDAILLVDESGTIVLMNRQAELIFGYPRSDLQGKTVDILLPEALQSVHVEHRSGFMEDPRIRPMGVGLDLKAKRKNGSEVPVDINLSPVATNKGMYVIATVRRRPNPSQKR
jgi:PAS domain S-box-containing protein